MGNCASSPCGENYESNNIKERTNKKSKKSLFENGYSNIESKNFLNKYKDNPVKLNHDKLRLDTFIDENNIDKTNSSITILGTNLLYEKNITEITNNKNARSNQNSDYFIETNPYVENDKKLKTYIYKGNTNVKINEIKNKKNIFIQDELEFKDEEKWKREKSSTLIPIENFSNEKNEANVENNLTNENKLEEFLEENKIVEEIRQNKIFYNSDGLKSFRRKTPKQRLYNIENEKEKNDNLPFGLSYKESNIDSRHKFNVDSGLNSSPSNNLKFENHPQISNHINYRYEQLLRRDTQSKKTKNKSNVLNNKSEMNGKINQDKNIFRKNKNSNLTILTNQQLIDNIFDEKIEIFNKNLNHELRQNYNLKSKEIMLDSIENLGEILVIFNIFEVFLIKIH